MLSLLESKTNIAPEAFPQSAQYKKNLATDADDDDAEGPAAKPVKKRKKKEKKRPAQVKDAVRSDGSSPPIPDGSPGNQLVEDHYEPQKYRVARKNFLDDLKSSGMTSSRDREDAWNKSSAKRSLLSTIPLSELKRRRFVPKECKVHPYV